MRAIMSLGSLLVAGLGLTAVMLVAALQFGGGVDRAMAATESPTVMSSASAFCEAEGATTDAWAKLGSTPSGQLNLRRLTLASDRYFFEPGQTVYFRLFNGSNADVGYGARFIVQHRRYSGWVRDPASPGGPWPLYRIALYEGGVGGCKQFRIPDDHRHGRLRIVQPLQISLGPDVSVSSNRAVEFAVG
jgi:hypothetical protein